MFAAEHYGVEPVAGRANDIGKRVRDFFTEKQKHSEHIGDIRGLGAMVGIEFVKSRKTKEPNPELVASLTA